MMKHLSKLEVHIIVDAIEDALLEIEDLGHCEMYSQGIVDKLRSSLEILKREELE